MPRPNLYLLVTALFWGFNFISLKIVYADLTPPALLFLRFWITWGALALISAINKEPFFPPKHLRWRVWGGGLGSMGIYMVLFLEGTSRTGPGMAAIILATVPLLIALLSSAVGYEPFSLQKLVGAVLAFFGVVAVILGRPLTVKGELVGDLLTFGSACTWALSVILLRPAMKEIKPLSLFQMSMLGAAPLVVVYGLFPAIHTNWYAVSMVSWMNVAQITLCSGLLGFAFYYKGIGQLGPTKATLYQFLVPPITVFFAWLIFHEKLEMIQGLGLLILMSGLLCATFLDLSKFRRPQPESA